SPFGIEISCALRNIQPEEGKSMGLRFRRSVQIVPGLWLNFGLRSTSISVGRRGLNFTSGTKGSRVTAGLPGTGLSYTHQVSSVRVRCPFYVAALALAGFVLWALLS